MKLIILAIFLLSVTYVNSVTTALWYYRGLAIVNGTFATLNVGDTFVLTCIGKSGETITSPLFPAIVITKDSPMGGFTITTPEATVQPGLTPVGGTTIYDTVNGVAPGYDNFLNVPIFLPFYNASLLTSAQVIMYNIYVKPGDEGDYYCNYINGVAAAQDTPDAFASSAVFTLTINTPETSKSGRTANNWRVNYPIVIATAAKTLF